MTPSSPSPSDADQPISMFGQAGRIGKVAAHIAAARSLWNVAHSAYRRVRESTEYTISVEANDPIYPDLHLWILEQIPAARRRSIVAQSARRHEPDGPVDSDTPATNDNHLEVLYDGRRTQHVTIASHRVAAIVDRSDRPSSIISRDITLRSFDRIVFTARTVTARDAILDHLTQLAHQHFTTDTTPTLFTVNTWGDWTSHRHIEPRPIDSVFLPEGQITDLINDLTVFISNEHHYTRLGIPWHRGYLLHGPPGTGKTSIAKALGAHFGLDVYFVSLGDLTKDAALLGLIARIPRRSMLLLEDIDIYHAATTRDDAPGGASLAGLLNALDGVSTPHGLITVMTTNHLDRIDPAIRRSGRADQIINFGHLTQHQLEAMYAHAYNTPLPPTDPLHPDTTLTPADITGIIKVNLHNPDGASHAINQLKNLHRVTQELPT